jgi:sulfate adenylyltransferase subunit 2
MVDAALEAGRAANRIYLGAFEVQTKADDSPVTAADHLAEAIILRHLARHAPGIDVVAEEQVAAGVVPVVGDQFFLVDPLDGTKEFIHRRGDFTVNIALIRRAAPVLGVVYAPAKGELFVGNVAATTAERASLDTADPVAAGLEPIRVRKPPAAGVTAVASRSHRTPQTDAYLAGYTVADLVSVGSSLKFCLVAAGTADLYPRLGPTNGTLRRDRRCWSRPAARCSGPTRNRCATASRSSAIPGSWRAVASCPMRSPHEGPAMTPRQVPPRLSGHLKRLEDESIGIMREVVAEFANPVMLYSIGKDSGVMLHLALKAFFPAKPPFPLLHVDTGWKFRDMIRHRDMIVERYGFKLLTYTNPDGVARGIDPIRSGSQVHTQVMKTEALKQALDLYGFDAAFGGARRDEEKSRAKERIFSVRSAGHTWEPRNQRPELWHLYNTRLTKGETIRVFPLSNWTELDIWLYTRAEDIPVVPLYFAAPRSVVTRDGQLIMRDDERMPLLPGEQEQVRSVRFRSLGCYPLSAAIESSAATLDDIISEMVTARTSERSGRLIDSDEAASMERKKREGYF